jgi:hypothetical protein
LNVKRVLDSLNLHQIKTQLAAHYHQKGPGSARLKKKIYMFVN